MTGFGRLSIRAKLLVVITAITFSILALATAMQLLYQRHAAEAGLVTAHNVLGRVVAGRSAAALAFADQRVANDNLGALAANPAVLTGCIYDGSGQLFASYHRQTAPHIECSHHLIDLPQGISADGLFLTEPITVDQDRVGTLTIHSSLTDLAQQTRNNLLAGGLVLFGAAVLTTLAASRLQRLVSGPIVRLAGTATQISQTQDYQLRAKTNPDHQDEVGQLVLAFNSMLDVIGERDRSLRHSEARFRALVEGISAILYTSQVSAELSISYISPQVEHILGDPPHAWTQQAGLFAERLHHEDRERVLNAIAASQTRGVEFICEYRMLHRNGNIVWIRNEATLVRDEHDRPILMQGLMHDISQQKQAEAKIHYLAYHDGLTELPNRRLFRDRLAETIARWERYGTRFAVHFLDLDQFKVINDSLGHPAGDALLQAAATRLKAIVRHSDTFARFGGDEFAAIQTGVETVEDASFMAQRFIDALRDPFVLDATPMQVGTSVGIVAADSEALTVDGLMRQADVALYKAKETGGNSFAFYEDRMTTQLRREIELINGLPAAIDNGELFLVYQPQVALADESLVGLEVLSRWRHPRLGMISPCEFIPLAEKRGIIGLLGTWVLDQACRQVAEWRAQGLSPGRIAVNVSPIQLRKPGFANQVLERLTAHDISGDLLELEFTESIFLESTESNLKDIAILSERGVQFAIDDFGTGFSSLAYLRRFRVDTLKIDQTFVRSMVENPSDAEIVRATVALGHGLGLATLAEGVETRAQANMLHRQGCTYAQGYFFGCPLSAAEVARHLAG